MHFISKKIDVLNLEWPESERDLHISTPICIELGKNGLTIKQKNIFNGFCSIIKYRPRLLLISNPHGSFINLELFKFAHFLGIKTISLISEGNINSSDINSFIWGINKSKKLYVDYYLLWSEKSKVIAANHFPELKNNFVISGGTGFDRYKLLNFLQKGSFFEKYPQYSNFKKIVGIAGWGFDLFMPGPYFEMHKSIFLGPAYGLEQVEIFRNDLKLLQDIYLNVIRNNPETLFILRYHPGNMNFENSEFNKCINEKNVFISTRQKSDIKIEDLISISDLWISYESTTNLEAWLLGKTTFFINPTNQNFTRSTIKDGNPIIKTANEAQILIDEFFNNGTIKSFENLKSHRNQIIMDTIGYADGLNHKRAAKIIQNHLEKSTVKKKNYLNLNLYRAIKSTIKYFINYEKYHRNKFKEFKEIYKNI